MSAGFQPGLPLHTATSIPIDRSTVVARCRVAADRIKFVVRNRSMR
jgi:hypothetical protein